MDFKFTIPSRLPGLNEIIKSSKSSPFAYSSMKKTYMALCLDSIRMVGVKRLKGPVSIFVHWIEPNAKRDFDNVCAGIKFILDALVFAEVIPNDTQKYLTAINHSFGVPDKGNPRIEVTLKLNGTSTENLDFGK